MGFEKALEAVKDQIQYRSQSLLNLASGYFRPCYPLNPEITLVAMMTGMTYFKLTKRFTVQNFALKIKFFGACSVLDFS